MTDRKKHRYEFDCFCLDPEERLLVHAGKPVPLTPKVFDTLVLLIQNSRHLVRKDDLMKALWPDSFVEEVNLNQNISQLRKALGDTVQAQRYIVTIPGSGYRFAVPVKEIEPGTDGSDLLIMHNSRSRIVIEKEEEQVDAGALPAATEARGLQLIERRIAKSWMVAVSIAVMAVAIALGALLHSHRGKPLSKKDTIVVGDFENNTGDSVFDDTLKQALAVQLEQSPFLNVLSDQRLNSTLRLMGQRNGDRVTEQVGLDLCQRVGSKALVAGSIASLGNHYVIGLNAINCVTGDALVKEQVEAPGKEDVLKALGKAATDMRSKLGESLISVQKFDTPVEQATTPSLDALKAFSLGMKTWERKGDFEAIPFFKRAIELDPNFALAYVTLGASYSNLEQDDLARDSVIKAYEVRERVSERERYFISANYYLIVTGELEKANQTLELWAQSYPRDDIPLAILGSDYMNMGQWERALPVTQESLRLEPNDAIEYDNLEYNYLALNRLEEARAAFELARTRVVDHWGLHLWTYYLAFLRGDAGEMEKQVAWAAGKPGEEDILLSAQSYTEAYCGRLQMARESSRRAVESARRAEAAETAATRLATAALIEAEFGNGGQARQGAQAALAMSPGRDVKVLAALALARAGGTARAQGIARELARSNPGNTLLIFYWLPTIQAAVELNRNAPGGAVDLLKPSTTT